MVVTKLLICSGILLLIKTSLVQSLLDRDPAYDSRDKIKCGGVRTEETSWLGEVIDPEPEDEPNRDRSTWRPFQTFVVPANPAMSSDESKRIIDAGVLVNDRLSPLLKSWHLTDVRTPRRWMKEQNRCVFPNKCGAVTIPPEYHQMCLKPSGDDDKQWVKEPGVRQDEDSKATTYALVVFVDIRYEPYLDDCRHTKSAYSHICFWDKKTFRPTHGSIKLCTLPSALTQPQLADIIMHHIIHIMTRGTMLGYYNPKFLNLTAAHPDRPYIERGDIARMQLRAKYNTWQTLKHDWAVQGRQGESLGRSDYETYAAVSPSIMQIVRTYFACNDERRLRGAETAHNDRDSANFDADNLMDESHWTMRLFPDELMTPIRTGYPKISKLTLQILKETDWYDADLNAAQNLMFNYSSIRPRAASGVFNGCLVASEPCFKLFRRPISERPFGNLPVWSGPMCKLADMKERFWLQPVPLCSDDGRYRLKCESFNWASSGCEVLHIPVNPDYTDPDCRAGIWETEGARQFGMSVGPRSTCLTILSSNVVKTDRVYVPENRPFSGCFRYECDEKTKDAFIFNLNRSADQNFNCRATAHETIPMACKYVCSSGGAFPGNGYCPDICGLKYTQIKMHEHQPMPETTAASQSGCNSEFSLPSPVARIGIITIVYRITVDAMSRIGE